MTEEAIPPIPANLRRLPGGMIPVDPNAPIPGEQMPQDPPSP